MKSELLQITIPLFVLSIVLFSIMSARVKVIKPFKKITLVYILISALIYGLLGFIGFLEQYIHFYFAFFLSGAYFICLGIFNNIVARHYLPWYDEINFLFGLIFNIIIAALGTIIYLYIYYYLPQMGVNKFHLFNVVLYFVPFLVQRSVDYYFDIPKSDFKKWLYPIGKEIEDPSEYEMESPLVVAFEFQKRFDNNNVTIFRAKAPKHMEFGKLFYYFILDYNTKHNDSKIEYIYEKSKSYCWVFYIKPIWFGRRVYLDPEKTVAENYIEEDAVIIAQRVFE